jgi:hypothetical protein
VAQDVSITRAGRMTDDRRARLTQLLAKPTLDGEERGELAALARQGSQADRDAANARVGRTSAGQPRRPAVSPQKAAEAIGEAVGRALDKALTDRGW